MNKIQPIINAQQNALQRGFTKNSSPMNCSLIIEESLHEQRDRCQPLYIAFLDAKSAFDVVNYDILMRKRYHMGVEGAPWLLIRSLHEGSATAVEWEGSISEPFQVHQGVKQGGILSTDLYNVYNNGSLDRLAVTKGGFHIGEICCAGLYGSITRLDETSVEKQLTRRQLSVKSYRGSSLFVEIRHLCVKYNLPDPYSLLDCLPSKYHWKRVVQKAVNTYGVDILKQRASLYSSLEFLCVDSYWPGKKHHSIQNVGCVSDVPRVHTKLKLVTGVYVLQINRACFHQNNIDATCQLCHEADETIARFLLDCPVLESVRRPVLAAICYIGCKLLQGPVERDQYASAYSG